MKREQKNVMTKNYKYDSEMFNFIINKRTFLTANDNFVS
jgi:hypothetical protein